MFDQSHEIARFLSRTLYYPVVAVFVINLVQRRHMRTGLRKRYATLHLGALLLAFWGATFLLIRFDLGDLFLIPLVLACVAVVLLFRDAVLPYRLRCAVCRRRLGPREILFYDSNLCAGCFRENVN